MTYLKTIKKNEELFLGVKLGISFSQEIKKKNINNNAELTQFYLTYFFDKFFSDILWYKNLLDLVGIEFDMQQDLFFKRSISKCIVYSLFSSVKNKILGLCEYSEFQDNLIQNLEAFVNTNREVSSDISAFIIEFLIDNKILKSNSFQKKLSIIDNQVKIALMYISPNFVDVFIEKDSLIPFEGLYCLKTLDSVIMYFMHKAVNSKYVKALRAINLNKEKLESFVLDYSNLNYSYDDFEVKEDKSLRESINVLFEQVCHDKFLLNSYCFHVIAVSNYEKYFFSEKKSKNILFQKNDPYLNLNPQIYDFLVEDVSDNFNNFNPDY